MFTQSCDLYKVIFIVTSCQTVGQNKNKMNWYRSKTQLHLVEVIGNRDNFETRLLFYNDYNSYPIWTALQPYIDKESQGSKKKQLSLFVGEKADEVVRLLLKQGLTIKSWSNTAPSGRQPNSESDSTEKWTLTLPNVI